VGITLRRRFCSDRCRIYSHRRRPPIGLEKLKPPKRPQLSEKGRRLTLKMVVEALEWAEVEDPVAFRELLGIEPREFTRRPNREPPPS
jgi:hypothetical protein